MRKTFSTKPGNEILHEIRNDYRVTAVYFATSKNMTVKSTNFHIIILTNLLRHLLMETQINITYFDRQETAF
jgi:hypothetical protein